MARYHLVPVQKFLNKILPDSLVLNVQLLTVQLPQWGGGEVQLGGDCPSRDVRRGEVPGQQDIQAGAQVHQQERQQ